MFQNIYLVHHGVVLLIITDHTDCNSKSKVYQNQSTNKISTNQPFNQSITHSGCPVRVEVHEARGSSQTSPQSIDSGSVQLAKQAAQSIGVSSSSVTRVHTTTSYQQSNQNAYDTDEKKLSNNFWQHLRRINKKNKFFCGYLFAEILMLKMVCSYCM